MLRSLLAATALAALLSGCALGPDFLRPADPTTPSYTGTSLPAAVGDTDRRQALAIGAEVTASWWSLFHSDTLDQIVRDAIAGSPTLAMAQAKVEAARAAADVARGGASPQVAVLGDANRARANLESFGLPGGAKPINLFAVGPRVSYDLDLFGRTRRTIEQKTAEAERAEHQLAAAYLSLTGNAVRQAIAIAAYNDEIKTLETVIADDERTVALVRSRLDNGAASKADLLRAQSQLDTDRAMLPPLNQGRAAARNALAVLTGRAPGDWLPPDFSLAQFTLPAELPVSLPSTLARRRPDIAIAEAELHAASAAIGVAEAARYPDITLSAAMLPLAATPAGLFEASNLLWSFGGSLAAPIYAGGALEAREREAKAEYDAAMANYRDTVVKAFGQVADVLHAIQNDADLTAAERRAVASAGEATELARIRYRDGAASLNDVLDAERLYQQAKLSQVDAEARRYRDSVDLMAALGGGWKARG